MKTPAGRRTNKYFVASFGFLVIAALAALPSVQSRRLARTSIANPDHHSSEVPESKAATSLGRWNWMPNVAAPTVGGETIEIFAADCTTAQTAFAAGETICAKTNGVDLTTPGNYYVNWFHPDSSETNGGTITTNPQYTLFSIPTSGSYLGTWKANIGRVTLAEGSIIGNPPLFTVSAAPTIATFAYALGACTNTPKTNFVVGETVCARTTGVDPQFNRRFAWVDADSVTREFTPITTDPATDDYAILLTETSIGTWKANVVSSRGTTVVGTPFTVSALTPSVDLSIGKALTTELEAGQPATFTISVYSRGPNDAQNVVITDTTPANATFLSATQTEGSGFTCTGSETITCNGAVMKPGERAVFEFVYTAGAAGQTITNTASVHSDTPEVVAGEDTDGDTIDDASEDNSATAGPYTISPGNGGGGGSCSFDCPDNVVAAANTTVAGHFGAFVSYPSAIGINGDCGLVQANPHSGSFFEVGTTTTVHTSSDAGPSCSFTVTVLDTPEPTIICPTDKVATASGGTAAVVVGLPSTTPPVGVGVTVTGVRSDGSPAVYDEDGALVTPAVVVPLTDPYPIGNTGITWTVTDSYGRTASCTQRIIVHAPCTTDIAPPTFTFVPPALSVGTGPNSTTCGAVLDDELIAPEALDDCVAVITTTGIPAGNLFPIGSTTIHFTATDGAGHTASATQLITVTDNTPPVIFAPANANYVCPSEVPAASAAQAHGPDIIVGGVPQPGPVFDNCGVLSVTVSQTTTGAGSAASPQVITRTYTATDIHGNSASSVQIITVIDAIPPVFTFVPPAVTAYTGPGATTCDTVVSNATLGTATATDNCAGVTVTRSPSGNTFPVGPPTTITWTATDWAGNTATATQTVTVIDNTPPVITTNGQTPSMWPPNHKYQTFGVTNFVTGVNDNCDGPISVGSVVIVKVTSDEIENGNGDGNTLNDIVIAPDCKSVQLRSEREGNSNGRVYTIYFKVADSHGNFGTATAKVVVQHNPGETAVDSGVHYTVCCGGGTCP